MKSLICTTFALMSFSVFGLASSFAQTDATRPIIPSPAASPAASPATSPAAATQPALEPAATPASAPTTQPSTAPGVPTPLTSSVTTAPLPQVSSSYVIGPEDALSVNVWKEPTVSGSYTVRPDGMISMPLLGDLAASGLTPVALSTDITGRLKKFINDPLVTVTVLTVNSKHYYLTGQIGRPGTQPLTPGITPLQAIVSAGGPSEYANSKKIYILRTDAQGKTSKIPFDYKKAIKTGDQQGVTLQPNDTIVVP